MRPPTRHPSACPRRPAAVSLAVLAGLLAAGCGGGGEDRPAPRPTTDPRPLLQPAAEPGPHPFSASTALTADHSAARRPPAPDTSGGPSAVAGRAPRTVDGATPGLYGGTHSLPSCDVDQQARLLAADGARARAFAQAAGVTPGGLGAWLRDLTPVMLRADTRVTGHGYRDGEAVPQEAVLQAGTAVLVDGYGAPRVRCAAGSPLRAPADARPPTGYRGEPWPGFRPERVVQISPTQQVLDSLLLVNVLNGTWLEREIGTRGEADREPAAPRRTPRTTGTSRTRPCRTAPGRRRARARPPPPSPVSRPPAGSRGRRTRARSRPAARPRPPAPPAPPAPPVPPVPAPDAGLVGPDTAEPGPPPRSGFAPEEPAPGEPAPGEPALEGPALEGPVPGGPGPEGPAFEEPAPQGPVPDGGTTGGAVPDGLVPDRTAPDGPVPDGTAPDGPTRYGTGPGGPPDAPAGEAEEAGETGEGVLYGPVPDPENAGE
ncbi:DUF6777 domain-containing protein [Streptomyces sudanensis]|uniref:DUF6777 domain-containing protein n=1 Tax=Streptomyces sudanensis TaxID=436397 RepID=UPI0020CBE7CF|nr:DUF6777 domain-containing protein [Streptomyces sudanensis]MCP9956380.1 hypothetical protein [Streptomyces sudanensis]